MKELHIKGNDSGQRLDKYLKKYLNAAPQSFIYKMLRKKNIILNGSKADGSEILKDRDVVKMFLADETIEKFREQVKWDRVKTKCFVDVLYEDEDILLVNKPVGVLSQKAKSNDISINEIIIDYLINNGKISIEELATFKPSVCNRLDRNTSGIITFGKTLKGTQVLSDGLKNRNMEKYYLCAVNGVISKRALIDGYLVKNHKTNKVSVIASPVADSERIVTEYIPVSNNGRVTFLKIKLHTGKTHQIRAHLASINHPLVGDYKYGYACENDIIKKKYGIKEQLLHAFEVFIPEINQRIYAPMPELMSKYIKGEQLWEPGNQEDLEVLH